MNRTKRAKPKKKYFTLEEANATLPLLRAILRDVTTRFNELQTLRKKLAGSS